MNLEEERKLFEDWISTKEWIQAGMSGRSIDDILVFDGDYQEYHFRTIQECWETWQASTQRQGYKLVPIDTIKRTIGHISIAACHPHNTKDEEDVMYKDMGIIEAVIGVCDE